MCNCYASCGADFEGTIRMVGGARGLGADEVKQTLKRIKEEHGQEKEYLQLRSKLPADFPF